MNAFSKIKFYLDKIDRTHIKTDDLLRLTEMDNIIEDSEFNNIKHITISSPIILSSEFVFVAVDLQNSLVYDNDNGLIAKAVNHTSKLIIHNGLEDEKIDSLLTTLKTVLKGTNYDIGTYGRDYQDLRKIENFVKLKPVDCYGRKV